MSLPMFAESFMKRGGQWAFGVPGGGPSLELVDAIMRSGARFITTGHETTSALMAGAVARLTGAPSAAISIKGPGFMNLAPGLLSNAYEGYPMLAISESYPSDSAPRGRRHKWLQQGRVGADFLRGCSWFTPGHDAFSPAWEQAKAEFPGPVLINLAEGEELEVETVAFIADDPTEVANAIRQAERPLIIVGSLALRAPWRQRLQNLQLPIFTTPAAKGVISELSRHCAGVYTGDGKPLTPEHSIVPKADLVIGIGVRCGEILTTVFKNTKVILIDTPEIRSKGLFPPPGLSGVWYFSNQHIAELFELLTPKVWGDTEIASALHSMQDALRRWPWSPARAFELAMDALPGATHVLDTGNFTVVGEHVLRVMCDHEILGTPNGRFLGMGVGYSLGAALVSKQPVVLWIGDGGIRAFLSELSLAVEHNLRLLVVVMADGFFGSIRGRAKAKGWSTEPLRMRDRELGRVAKAMGMDTLAGDSDDLFVGALKAWRDNPSPMLIQCNLDPDDYIEITELLR